MKVNVYLVSCTVWYAGDYVGYRTNKLISPGQSGRQFDKLYYQMQFHQQLFCISIRISSKFASSGGGGGGGGN